MRDIVSKHGTFFTGLGALPAFTTTQTSAAVNLSGYNGAMVYLIAGTWTDGTHTPVIQESANGTSGWASVATTDLIAWTATSASSYTPVKAGNAQFAAITSAATAINQRIGYIGGKQYIRVVTTVTGSPSTGALYDIVIEAGLPDYMPANV